MSRQTLKARTLPQVRAAMTRHDLAAAVLLRATAVVTVVSAAPLVACQVLVHWHPLFASFTLGAGHLGMIWVGAALGGTGFLACCVLEGRSYMRRWLLYVYAFAFLAFSFVLLMEWFEVSGASGLRS